MGNCGRASNQCQGDWQTEKPGAPTCYGHALPAATGANGCHGPGSGVSSVVGVREGARQHLDCLNPTIALPPGIPWSPFTSPWNGLHGQQGLPYLWTLGAHGLLLGEDGAEMPHDLRRTLFGRGSSPDVSRQILLIVLHHLGHRLVEQAEEVEARTHTVRKACSGPHHCKWVADALAFQVSWGAMDGLRHDVVGPVVDPVHHAQTADHGAHAIGDDVPPSVGGHHHIIIHRVGHGLVHERV
mmetsp:Transcript_113527/g.197184  ORF Transcript_113527/g.197184 Transcript_113527/m.197184 type:complete len:241 (-) Transcript_113527:719-1441(-)